MLDQPNKSALDELMKEVPASSVPLDKPKEAPPPKVPDVDGASAEAWGTKSNKLREDYKYGSSLAKFGENELNIRRFFKRLSYSICAIVSNEYQKRGESSDSLKPNYDIIESSMLILANEVSKKNLKDFDVASVIAALQGFVTNYKEK